METKTITKVNNSDIRELVKKRKNTYLNDPLQIVADYNNEGKNIDEYNGRQLLEMIQNANDESDTSKAKKVFLDLKQESLIIANNGNAFSKGGVESLMYSDLSPKTMEENKVGKKGLGFRSILNWSKEIYIASYDLHLKFSQQHADNFLKDLISEKPNIDSELKRKTKKSNPISILRCPYLEVDSSNKKVTEYDTVIELSLKEGVYAEIIKQIELDIIPEILIFLNKLEEIEVQTPEQHFSLKKEQVSGCSSVKIIKKDHLFSINNQEWTWNIIEEDGFLEGVKETKKYELKIAYNPHEKLGYSKLFSFFRTEVNFPYPVIAHGTFELKSDRNNLTTDKNNFNKKLLAKLAQLMVKCSIKITKNGPCSYEGLKLLVPNSTHKSGINSVHWNFNSLLKAETLQAKIFPTINNVYTTLSSNPKYYSLDLESSIPEKGKDKFDQLLQYTDDKAIERYLESSSQNLKYEDDILTEKINLLIENKFLSGQQKVNWIYLICSNYSSFYKTTNSTLPNLFIDTDKNVIGFGHEAILPPEGNGYKMPARVDLAFIHTDQHHALKEKFGKVSTRELVDKLQKYKITEYSLKVALQKIISSTHTLIKQNSSLKKTAIKEMHIALYVIFKNIKEDAESKVHIPKDIPSPLLLTRNGMEKPANELYFGKEYSCGHLMEGLLKTITNEDFVGSIETNEFQSLTEQRLLEKYLKWIGVSDLPRKKVHKFSTNTFGSLPYIRSIVEKLKYPYVIPSYNETLETIKDLDRCQSFSAKVLWYERFEEIIKCAPIEHIITWFILDKNLHNTLTSNTEEVYSELTFTIRPRRYGRKIHKKDLCSYILFILQDIAFIPVEKGEKVTINECLLDCANLKPLLKSPEINYGAQIFIENRIDKELINYVLKRLGVKDSLKDIKLSKIYEYLLKHHEAYKDEPKNIQNFYTAVIEATKNISILNKEIPNRRKYLTEGKIYVEENGNSHFTNISKATYVDNPNFSQDLLRKLSRAKLPKRAGNSRMQNLFGIQPLDYIKFNVLDDEQANNKINQQFTDEVNNLKPYLFTYRFQKALSKTQEGAELLALKKLKIKTCSDVTINYELADQLQNLRLRDYEYIQDDNSKIFYVKIPSSYCEYIDLKGDFRFKETVSDIICAVLKVTENRKDFMLLLGENSNNWDNVLDREFDDYKLLQKDITQLFDDVLTVEQKFWEALFNAAKRIWEKKDIEDLDAIYSKIQINEINKDEFFQENRSFDFNDLSNFNNFKMLNILFAVLNIDITDFNKQGFKFINLNAFWENKLHTWHKEFIKKGASYYFKLKDKNQYRAYQGIIDKYNSCDVVNSINFDYKKAHKNELLKYLDTATYNSILQSAQVDLDTVFQRNLDDLKQELSSSLGDVETYFTEYIYDNEFKINIIFNDVEKVKEQIRLQFTANKSENINLDDKEVSISDNEYSQQAIGEEFNNHNYKFEEHEMKSVPKREKRNKKGSGRQSTNSKIKDMSNQDIGFIGEKLAYEFLSQNFDSVDWVSEYALRAGQSKGTDGLGYDFECSNGDATRFIEVKATTGSDLTFLISENEINVGHDNHNVFDVLLILNVLSEDRKFIYLKSIFNYQINDSFLDNSKFTVENDTYKIRFK